MIQDILVKSYDTEWYDRQLIVCHLLRKSSGFLLYQTPKSFIFFLEGTSIYPCSFEVLRKVRWNIQDFEDLFRRLILFLVY